MNKRNSIHVGTRVTRLRDYRRYAHVANAPQGTVTAVVRDVFGAKGSEVRWDAGSTQLCENADLRVVR